MYCKIVRFFSRRERIDVKTMEKKSLLFLCRALAKATSTAVRLYQGDSCVEYYSVYHLHPDPAEPYLPRLLNDQYRAGVFCTPLLQFYGFLSLQENCRIIVGPSCLRSNDQRLIDEYLFLLQVPLFAAGSSRPATRVSTNSAMLSGAQCRTDGLVNSFSCHDVG